MDTTQVDKLFHAIDAMDPDAFVAFLTPTGTFTFGNAPPVHGRPAVRELVHGFWQSIRGSAPRSLARWRPTPTCRHRWRRFQTLRRSYDGSARAAWSARGPGR